MAKLLFGIKANRQWFAQHRAYLVASPALIRSGDLPMLKPGSWPQILPVFSQPVLLGPSGSCK